MKKIEIILLSFVAILIGIAIFSYFEIRSQGVECMIDPLRFGAERFSKEISPLSCTCSFANSLYSPFILTENGTMPIETNQPLGNYNISLNITEREVN